MPKTVSRVSGRADASAVANRSGCGLGDNLSSGYTNGSGIGLGHSDTLPRKRSLDNLENIPPPFGLDGAVLAPRASSCEKPALSLLDITAQQLSQNQRKQRRTMMTNSSPGGRQHMVSNPRRMTQTSDSSFLRSLPLPHLSHLENKNQSKPASTSSPVPIKTAQKQPSDTAIAEKNLDAQQHKQNQSIASSRQVHTMRHTIAGGNASSFNNSGARLRRLPKRNLKPLDFSSLYRPNSLPGASANAPACAGSVPTSTASTGYNQTPVSTITAKSKPAGPHSSGHVVVSGAGFVSLPVSPVHSSPVSSRQLDVPSAAVVSPALAPCISSKASADALPNSSQPTPPSTGHRRKSAFSGLLASAYERASAKRLSKRVLNFGDSPSIEDTDSLQTYDPVLGPRCPVIGDPHGVFAQQGTSNIDIKREQPYRHEPKPVVKKTAAGRDQSSLEQPIVQNRPRGRPPGRKVARASSCASSTASTSKRPISECKYCGKQYKYHSKLVSHEQHCSSRLEALLYSADENEQHIIYCHCGPRHDRPVGARDDLPMIQCDNCLMWLHIECVGIDENNLPDEFFCHRCDRGSSAEHPGLLTPKRRPALVRDTHGIMSPESRRLAELLVDVPDRSSDTEDEPMNLRVKAIRSKKHNRAGDALSSEDTMSISDAAEVVRFHRQGSATKRSLSPIAPRMAQSEANVSPAHTPSRLRRRVRADAGSKKQTVHTDTLSSDFLSLPLPETIFSEKPNLVGGGPSFSIPPALCSQQPSMDDLSRFLAEPQQQWSLAQLSNMLGGAPAPPGDMIGGGSSFYLDQALADLGLGFGHGNAGHAAQVASMVDGATVAAAPEGPLSELVDLPVDNEFSALLESIASGGSGVDGGFGAILHDDIVAEIGSSMSISAPISVASAANGPRAFGPRVNGCDPVYEHGSSSTITLMHDNSSILGSCDDVAVNAASAMAQRSFVPAARPPPGMPGMMRSRNNTAGSNRRAPRAGAHQQQQQQPVSQTGSIALAISSNPPSSTGLEQLDIGQLLASANSTQLLDWSADGDVLEHELEGLINFDA
ncbi:hypothetical protein GGF40_000391 [Coemansia sp. RSA 1286]|nr:hypothetical protein GGF39_000439 [Coemansia sp. RSA 1721]KAJ2640029.1 hypothetical protein GGF40_000391 [Coemansia sp. RSA 1286]